MKKSIEEQKLTFEDNFFEDLESWFSADIACCDNCIKEFLDYWPLANESNQYEFQKRSISLDCFYHGSRSLQFLYTKDEFKILKSTILCPRCNVSLDGHMWVYDLPFSFDIDIKTFELKINDISLLAEKTPFLLLKNDFALKVFDVLNKIRSQSISQTYETSLYRARKSKDVEELVVSNFMTPPKDKIPEGRYNHAGSKVLYLSSDMETCFYEVGKKTCYIAEFNLKKPIKVLDLTKPDELHEEYEDILNMLVYSSLLSRSIDTEGYYRPAYVFSRFISDCAKYVNFDAIKYPSTKLLQDNYNLVMLNDDIFENHIEIKTLYFFDKNNQHILKVK